jgi:Domain of unknown function (DUF1905)
LIRRNGRFPRHSDGNRPRQWIIVQNAVHSIRGPHPQHQPASYPDHMNVEFSGEMWLWKGPAPWHFITVPLEECGELEAASALVTYGWGMIPVTARIGRTEWKTSLFPKDERYIVPVKAGVRKVERLEVGDMVAVRLTVDI